jgi:thioredoxin 1
MSDAEVLELTDKEWEANVEKSDKPVIAMFHSPNCTHCRTMEPYFREYAKEFKGKVKFVRIDIAAYQWLGERYGVRGTPTFKFFCGGKPVSDLVGAIYPALLKKRIEEVLVYGEECAKQSSEVNYDISGYA